MDDSVGHHCGLAGTYNVPDAAARCYMGLFALQHRGQESAGIAVSDGKQVRTRKAMGLVTEVFSKADLDALSGHISIGHVRYSTTGSSRLANVQPLTIDTAHGQIAVAHNGNLVNARTLRDEFEAHGSIFQTSTDSEVIVHLLAQPEFRTYEEGLLGSLPRILGAYSFIFMTPDKLMAARDPQGFRPLVLGRITVPGQLGSIGEGWMIASETCALDQAGAVFEREIEPGELVVIDAEGLRSRRFAKPRPAHCMFEHVYFARPDSRIFGDYVHEVRLRLGGRLAREHPVQADVVTGVPDSGNVAAQGFARASGIPFDFGFIRSHYVGRSFIKPEQMQREQVVDMKFNAVRSVVDGKRVVVVDDSLVRGTTFRRQAKLLREAGATEIHLRISCPPTRHACYYGIDFLSRGELIAGRLKTVEAIREYLGIESLGYLSVEGLLSVVSQPKAHYCTACWAGEYPVPPVDVMDKLGMEKC
ncbi:MAG: amidophosphoribosyltransferase [Planctomycetota bacterium]|nr:amidophosphoribosyltransferase [Planctomycetota bacterium]